MMVATNRTAIAQQVLEAVRRTPGITTRQIADALGLDLVQVSSAASDLTRRGAIRRERALGKGRRYHLFIALPPQPPTGKAAA